MGQDIKNNLLILKKHTIEYLKQLDEKKED